MPVPIVHHPSYVMKIPQKQGFPIGKYGQLIQLLRDEGLATAQTLNIPEVSPVWWLELVHDSDYVDGILAQTADDNVMRRIGLPLSPELADRARISVAGTVMAAQLALKWGIACNTAGGSHHASASHGAGYCIFNDVAIAARVLQASGLAMNMLVVDLDVHQGDGTAEIFRGDAAVFTFSMHCQNNFPSRKQFSDLDIGLLSGTEDRDYLNILSIKLPDLLDNLSPDLVFYNAGVDPHYADLLGKLALTNEGIARRDSMVITACARRNIPIAGLLGGGYDRDAVLLAQRHAILYRVADHISRTV